MKAYYGVKYINMQKEVVVLGGAGFLGTSLCEALWQKGIKPIVLDKSLGCDLATTAGKETLKKAIVSADSRDGIDVVMMAARVGARLFDSSPLQPFKENKAINDNCIDAILDCARWTNGINVVFYSTSEAYGNADLAHIERRRPTIVDPMHARSLYAQEKLMAETMLNYYRSIGAIKSLCIFRPFNVSGKWQKRGVIYEMVKSAVNSGVIEYAEEQTREVTFVQDATRQALDAILHRVEGTFDMTSKMHVALEDLACCVKVALAKLDAKYSTLAVRPMVNPSQYIKTRGTVSLLDSREELDRFTELLVDNKTVEDIALAL